MRAWVVVVLAFLFGCYTRGQATFIDVTMPIAAVVAGMRRAKAQCFVDCLVGTKCNPSTGFCDELPCRGTCTKDEICDQSGPVSKCWSKPDESGVMQIFREVPPR
jgi:hypothetical protein